MLISYVRMYLVYCICSSTVNRHLHFDKLGDFSAKPAIYSVRPSSGGGEGTISKIWH